MAQLMTERNYTPETLEEAIEVIQDLRGDNKKLRGKNTTLREQLAEYGDDAENVTTLKAKLTELQEKLTEAETYKTKYEEINTQFEEVNSKVTRAERLEKVKPILSKLNINTDDAIEIALEKMGDFDPDKMEEAAKEVATKYPSLVSKASKFVPDTGRSSIKEADPSTLNIDARGKLGIQEYLENKSTTNGE